MLNLLAGQMDVVDKFRRGEDPYIGIASAAYGREITKADVLERGTGKQLELSCGYQSGAETIQRTAARGTYGPPVVIDLETAVRWRDLYRLTHPRVVDYWRTATRMIARLAGGPPIEWGPMTIKGGKLYAPNGMWIDYSTLEYDTDWQSWRFRMRQGWAKLYGGKLVQNVCELLCRLVLSQAMIRIADRGYKIATCTHDEVVIALEPVDAPHAEIHYETCKAEMECPPVWLPDLPLKVEGGVSERYEK